MHMKRNEELLSFGSDPVITPVQIPRKSCSRV